MRAIDFVTATAAFARQADARTPMRPMRAVVRMVAAGSERPEVFDIARARLDPGLHDEPDLIVLALAAFVRFTYRPWYRLAVMAEGDLAAAMTALQEPGRDAGDVLAVRTSAPLSKEAVTDFMKARPAAVAFGMLGVRPLPLAARVAARVLARYANAALFVGGAEIIDELAATRAETRPDWRMVKEVLVPSRDLWVFYGSNTA